MTQIIRDRGTERALAVIVVVAALGAAAWEILKLWKIKSKIDNDPREWDDDDDDATMKHDVMREFWNNENFLLLQR